MPNETTRFEAVEEVYCRYGPEEAIVATTAV